MGRNHAAIVPDNSVYFRSRREQHFGGQANIARAIRPRFVIGIRTIVYPKYLLLDTTIAHSRYIDRYRSQSTSYNRGRLNKILTPLPWGSHARSETKAGYLCIHVLYSLFFLSIKTPRLYRCMYVYILYMHIRKLVRRLVRLFIFAYTVRISRFFLFFVKR